MNFVNFHEPNKNTTKFNKGNSFRSVPVTVPPSSSQPLLSSHRLMVSTAFSTEGPNLGFSVCTTMITAPPSFSKMRLSIALLFLRWICGCETTSSDAVVAQGVSDDGNGGDDGIFHSMITLGLNLRLNFHALFMWKLERK